MRNTMDFLKKGLLMFLFMTLVVPLFAQSEEIISNSRDLNEDYIADLNGDCGLLLLSKHDDLVVSTTNLKGKVRIEVDDRNDRGFYQYRIIIPAGETRNPSIEVSREGNVYKTSITAVVKEDFFVAYRIESVSKPIRMDDQTDAKDRIFDKEKAELEFTTNIKDLQVKCPLELNADVTYETSKNDKNITIIRVIIPISVLTDAKAAIEKATQECEEWSNMLDNDPEAVNKKENRDKETELEEKMQAAENFFAVLTNIEIFADNTNHLSIDISDFGPKTKKCYAVLPMVIEKKVFATKSDADRDEGARMFSLRNYKEARAAFNNALQDGSISQDMRTNLQKSVALCDTCIRYDVLATKAIKEILRMKKEGGATQQEVAKYASACIDFLQVLFDNNPSVFYRKKIEQMEKLMASMPLSIKFTMVEWTKTLSEGEYIPEVEVWAYKGKDPILPNEYSSERKFRKCMVNCGEQVELIGCSNEKGEVTIDFNRKSQPQGLFFFPKNNGNIKVKYIEMSKLLQISKGDYMLRQIRLQMFTK